MEIASKSRALSLPRYQQRTGARFIRRDRFQRSLRRDKARFQTKFLRHMFPMVPQLFDPSPDRRRSIVFS